MHALPEGGLGDWDDVGLRPRVLGLSLIPAEDSRQNTNTA